MKRRTFWIAGVIAAGLAACAPRGTSTPADVEQQTFVQANLRAAEQAGGERYAESRRYMQRARQGMTEARYQSTRGNHDAARALVERAALDSQLALALARETNNRRLAEEMTR